MPLMAEKTRFRVLADLEVHDPHPLRLAAGAAVRILRGDLSWPGWVWVESADQAGWIPESFLRQDADGSAVLSRAFDGADLSAQRGEVLLTREEAPGWIYAENAEGRRGWFPLFNLKPHPHT